jgi:hypothetical protein
MLDTPARSEALHDSQTSGPFSIRASIRMPLMLLGPVDDDYLHGVDPVLDHQVQR